MICVYWRLNNFNSNLPFYGLVSSFKRIRHGLFCFVNKSWDGDPNFPIFVSPSLFRVINESWDGTRICQYLLRSLFLANEDKIKTRALTFRKWTNFRRIGWRSCQPTTWTSGFSTRSGTRTCNVDDRNRKCSTRDDKRASWIWRWTSLLHTYKSSQISTHLPKLKLWR